MKIHTLKVLAIGDTANVITNLRKYTKNVEIDLIDFKERSKTLSKDKDAVIFENYNLFQHR